MCDHWSLCSYSLCSANGLAVICLNARSLNKKYCLPVFACSVFAGELLHHLARTVLILGESKVKAKGFLRAFLSTWPSNPMYMAATNVLCSLIASLASPLGLRWCYMSRPIIPCFTHLWISSTSYLLLVVFATFPVGNRNYAKQGGVTLSVL